MVYVYSVVINVPADHICVVDTGENDFVCMGDIQVDPDLVVVTYRYSIAMSSRIDIV